MPTAHARLKELQRYIETRDRKNAAAVQPDPIEDLDVLSSSGSYSRLMCCSPITMASCRACPVPAPAPRQKLSRSAILVR